MRVPKLDNKKNNLQQLYKNQRSSSVKTNHDRALQFSPLSSLPSLEK
jgi:hypothetical protein